MTGFHDRLAIEKGFDAAIAKPFDIELMESTVSQLYERRSFSHDKCVKSIMCTGGQNAQQ